MGFLGLLTTSASAQTAAAIAADRYLSIARPMIYGDVVTAPRSSAAAAVAWILSLLISMPPLFFGAEGLVKHTRHRISSASGRCFVCFVLDPVSVHGPQTKHMKHLPQADDKRCRLFFAFQCLDTMLVHSLTAKQHSVKAIREI